jgi:hypothetical protein
MIDFSLYPFPAADSHPEQITGCVQRLGSILTLQVSLKGNLNTVIVPSPNPQPRRQDNLWQTTCFEFFIAPQEGPNYWEFNLSPSGDWNCYAFANYRQGMATEYGFVPVFETFLSPQALSLHLSLPLDPLIREGQLVDLGVTMVVANTQRGISYWALNHPGASADFHRRDSFLIRL